MNPKTMTIAFVATGIIWVPFMLLGFGLILAYSIHMAFGNSMTDNQSWQLVVGILFASTFPIYMWLNKMDVKHKWVSKWYLEEKD